MKKLFSFPLLCAVLVAVAIIFVLTIRSCATQPSEARPAASVQHDRVGTDAVDNHAVGDWPRTLQTPKGPLTLQQAPRRIVSTSVTITGTLLAINAPLVGSGATSRNSTVSDDRGFFTQWSEVAKRVQLEPLYITEPNAEAIAAAAPDLIVIAAIGGDSALKLYDQLSAIAPTLVIDYGDKSWQQLAIRLGDITGHEQDAQSVIDRFEQRVQEVKQAITLPPQPVSALVYYEDGRGVNLWTPASAQGKLLAQLGFTLAMPPQNVHLDTSMGKRSDILQLSGENMAAGLSGKTMLLFAADDDTVTRVMANPFLEHLEPVSERRVYAMGPDTFRLDYYSASNMLNSIERHFKNR